MRRSLSRWTLAASVAFAGVSLVTSGCKSSPLLAWFKSKPGPDHEAVVVDRGNEVQPPANGFTPHAAGESYANNAPQYGTQQAYGSAQGYGSPGYGAQGNGTRQASGYEASGYAAGGYPSGGYDGGGYAANGYDAGGYAAAPVGGYDSAGGTRVSDAGYGGPQNGYGANQYGSAGSQTGYGADPRGNGTQGQAAGGYANPSSGYGQPVQGGASAQQYQGGYDQSGQGQSGYDQGGYDQSGQGGYDQGGYGQGGYDQGSYDRGSQDSGYGGGYDAGGQGGYGANLPTDNPKTSAQPGQSGTSAQVANQLPAGLSTNPGDYRPGSVRRAAMNQPQEQTADASYDAAGYGSQSGTPNGYGDQGGYRESRGGGSFGGGDFDSSAAGQDTYYRR